MPDSIHAGHRQRLKERFQNSGLDNFTDIQVLELLLFYAIPVKDTNPIAHALLDHFGSLSQVLEADVEELKKAIIAEDYEILEEAKPIILKVGGMMCSHCTASVEKACMGVPGTVRASADLESKTVTVTGNPDVEALKKAIIAEDYEILEG